MQVDPLVETMRQYGQAFTARYDNDIAKICAALKDKEQTLNCQVVNHTTQHEHAAQRVAS